MRILLIGLVICLLVLANSLQAQPFTKITNSPTVAQSNASRGVAWIDYNGDGNLDLFVTNGPSSGQDNLLFKNNGAPDYTFSKIDTGDVVNDNGRSDGASWADFNNDGYPDLFVANWYNDANFLYRNSSSGLQTVSGQPVVSDGGYSETGSWGDYDNDGLIDLIVANSGDAGSTGPRPNWLYRNLGDGNFTRISGNPAVTPAQYTRGVNWIDADDDGDLDLYVVNESNQRNRFYMNQLKETGSADWIEIDSGNIVTDARTSWTASWGDYDNDGDADCFVGNWQGQNNALYRNDGPGSFTLISGDVIVSDGGYSGCSGWADYDNDGDLDLYVTSAYAPTAEKNTLYQNQLIESGTATFIKISGNPATDDSGGSYGFAWGDYDRDGDLDIYVARTFNENQVNVFYQNQSDTSGNWLVINCGGTISNYSAIGTKIRARVVINGNPVWLRRDISGQEGYCGQNLQVHFGLGDATVVFSLLIEWPAGEADLYQNVAVNQQLDLKEGDSPLGFNSSPSSPYDFHLEPNFPNPFNPVTTIAFVLPSPAPVRLMIFDILGRHIKTLVETQDTASLQAGRHEIQWDGTNHHGKPVISGIYYYQLTANRSPAVGKMVLVR